MKAYGIAAIAALLLAGCATVESGRPFNFAAAQSFEIGVTTRSQVEAALGAPMTEVREADGGSVIVYSHIESRANAFTGGTAQGTTAAYRFDSNGTLLKTSMSAPASRSRTR